MNKKIIGIFVMALLISTAIPVMGFQEMLDELDQYYAPNSYYSDEVIGDYDWYQTARGQTFKPNVNKLTRIQVLLYKEDRDPYYDSYMVELWDGNLQVGTVISQKVIDYDSIPVGMNWVEIDLPDVTVVPGDLYSISIYGEHYDWHGFGHVYWAFYDDGYPNGNAYYFNWTTDSWLVFKLFGQFWDNCFKTYGTSETNHPPNTPSQLSGPSSGNVGQTLTYTSSATDSDGDTIKYGLDVHNDGTVDHWSSSYYASGATYTIQVVLDNPGTYSLRLKAQDEHGAESGWSTPKTVTITSESNNPPNDPTCAYDRKNDELVVTATDPDGDQVKYGVDWDNDATVDQWTGFVSSGTPQNIECNGRKGTVGVIVEDEHGAQSNMVYVKSKDKLIEHPMLYWLFERLFQRFPFFEKILNLN
jgi:hypothetical protein